MQMKSFMMKMDDGYELCLNRWQPDSDDEIKGVIQLHHGLAEHSLRYDRFGSILAEQGYVLNAYDMRGHGRTAENADKNGTGIFGKLADKITFVYAGTPFVLNKNIKISGMKDRLDKIIDYCLRLSDEGAEYRLLVIGISKDLSPPIREKIANIHLFFLFDTYQKNIRFSL